MLRARERGRPPRGRHNNKEPPCRPGGRRGFGRGPQRVPAGDRLPGGGQAETATILPIAKGFADRHGLADMV